MLIIKAVLIVDSDFKAFLKSVPHLLLERGAGRRGPKRRDTVAQENNIPKSGDLGQREGAETKPIYSFSLAKWKIC